MKAAVIQPTYSMDYADAEKYFKGYVELLDKCDPSLDLIVMPECSDLPTVTHGARETGEAHARFKKILFDKAVVTAKRCNAIVVVNLPYDAGNGDRNTTHFIAPTGEVIGRYFKSHPAPGECVAFDKAGDPTGSDCDYSFSFGEPYVLEYGGLRYGFLTCYDFYFYENFSNLARLDLDIIIGCSHQRSDTHLALDIIGRFLAYNTSAYLVHASVSLGKDSPLGGSSMIVAPNGEMLVDMKSKTGLGIAEFDPHEKYLKPMGFGNPVGRHADYVESGRRPWLYRPAGPFIREPESRMPYPRVCAHRGFSQVAPENTLPAYGAAIGLGADEVELDLWESKDGVLVSHHDCTLRRCCNRDGKIWDYTLGELKTFDFGANDAEAFHGLEVLTFEDILKKFARQTIFNVHVKCHGEMPYTIYDEADKVVALIRKYDCVEYAYLMVDSDAFGRYVKANYPEIAVCASAAPGHFDIVDRAIEYGYQRVQLYKPAFTDEMIQKAHEHGIICNIFWADDPQEACEFIDRGIDCILTNNYLSVRNAVRAHLAEKAKNAKK